MLQTGREVCSDLSTQKVASGRREMLPCEGLENLLGGADLRDG